MTHGGHPDTEIQMQRTQQPGEPASRRRPRLHRLFWPPSICNVGLSHACIGGLFPERVRRRALPFGADSIALMRNLTGLLSWSSLLFFAGLVIAELARRFLAIANRLPRILRVGRCPTSLVYLLIIILIGVHAIGIEWRPSFTAASIASIFPVLTIVFCESVVRRTAVQQNRFWLEPLASRFRLTTTTASRWDVAV